MPAIITGARPSGRAVPYIDEMAERGFSKNTANVIARSPKGPQTYKLGNKRMVDLALLDAWFAAQARGDLEITVDDLNAVRADAQPNEAIRDGKRRAREASAA